MQILSNADTQNEWKQAFQDAVFELDPKRLLPKLERAQKAIEDRLAEVHSGDSSVPRELMELEDAQRTIQYLAKHELQV